MQVIVDDVEGMSETANRSKTYMLAVLVFTFSEHHVSDH